nr:hypothetical protein GCM10017611_67770 [Rhodococcus wratislaviensis]
MFSPRHQRSPHADIDPHLHRGFTPPRSRCDDTDAHGMGGRSTALSLCLKSLAGQLVVEMLLRNIIGLFAFQAAKSVAETSRPTANRSAISVRHSGAESRYRPGPEVR